MSGLVQQAQHQRLLHVQAILGFVVGGVARRVEHLVVHDLGALLGRQVPERFDEFGHRTRLHFAERFPWLHHVAEWTQHLATVRSFRYMSGAVIFMLIRRVVEGFAGWLVALACGIDVGPEFIALVIASLAIVTIIPSPPGNVGLYEVAVVAAYQWLGVAPEPALAAALLQHAVLLISALIPGALIALFVPGYARRDQR